MVFKKLSGTDKIYIGAGDSSLSFYPDILVIGDEVQVRSLNEDMILAVYGNVCVIDTSDEIALRLHNYTDEVTTVAMDFSLNHGSAPYDDEPIAKIQAETVDVGSNVYNYGLLNFFVDNGTSLVEKFSIDGQNSLFKFVLDTENLEITDAGSASATEQDWIEVEVGGNTGYIRVHASK